MNNFVEEKFTVFGSSDVSKKRAFFDALAIAKATIKEKYPKAEEISFHLEIVKEELSGKLSKTRDYSCRTLKYIESEYLCFDCELKITITNVKEEK